MALSVLSKLRRECKGDYAGVFFGKPPVNVHIHPVKRGYAQGNPPKIT